MFVSESIQKFDRELCRATLRKLGIEVDQKTSLGTVVGVMISRTKTPFVMFCAENKVRTYSIKACRINL